MRKLKVLMIAPASTHPGGITSVMTTWRAAGLETYVDVDEIATSAMDDPKLKQAMQALGAYFRVLRATHLARVPPDVVHIHFSSHGSLYRKLIAAWIVRSARIPYIAHLHSGGFERWAQQRRVHTVATRSLLSSAASVVVLADRWQLPASQAGAKDVTVLPNTIPPKLHVELQKVAAERTYQAGYRRPVTLLYYGRWAPIKGLDIVAAALREHGEGLPDLKLRLWGNGDRSWLERTFSNLPCGTVEIRGWLDDASKISELENASVLLYPSRSEGFGQTLLEAMAAGIRILASDAGAIPDVLSTYPDAARRIFPVDDTVAFAHGLRELVCDVPGSAATMMPLPRRFQPAPVLQMLVSTYQRVSCPSSDTRIN